MKTMLLFCSDPLNDRIVDSGYKDEFEAASALGIAYALINFEALTYEKNVESAIKRVAQQSEPTSAIFRGWMMKPEQYVLLSAALASRNVVLLNSDKAYVFCHYLPQWYGSLKSNTPQSTWTVEGESLDIRMMADKLDTFCDRPIIVKDWVKSRKHEWSEACYIPCASDRETVGRVVQRFLKLQGDDFNIGLVFREFVDFEQIGSHSQSGMPLTREFRLFYLNGKPIEISNYWSEGDYSGDTPPLDHFNTLAQRVQSKFFTMDVAKTQSGNWMIIELGDGQVASLPEHVDPNAFYRSLIVS